jgi:hypothetical protein
MLIWINDVDGVMWDFAAILGSGFGGANIHVAIHVSAICSHDFTAESSGESHRQAAFPDGGRADDRQESGPV